MDHTPQLHNKVVVVIGGAGLLGARFVHAIVAAGGAAVIADKNLTAAQACRSEVLAAFPDAVVDARGVDITSKKSLQKLLEKCVAEHGRIDGLVNSAYPRTGKPVKDLEELEYRDFCDNVDIHLGSFFLCCQQFAMHFARNGGGAIVNIASIYGVVAPRFELYAGTEMRNPVEYAVVKSGLIHMSRYFVKYYAGKKLRVNVVSPGGILDRQPKSFLRKYKDECLDKGMLDPEDISGAVVFLLSDESRYINGQNIVVDDGFTL